MIFGFKGKLNTYKEADRFLGCRWYPVALPDTYWAYTWTGGSF